MTGVLLHVIGDAVNNVGVIIAALVIWRTSYDGRFYADPAVSLAISFIILISSLPLGWFCPFSLLSFFFLVFFFSFLLVPVFRCLWKLRYDC